MSIAIFLRLKLSRDTIIAATFEVHKKLKFTSKQDTFSVRKACRLVQIPICSKWRKIMQSTTKAPSERFSEIFCKDDFLKSVRTPQEAIEIYQKVKDILIKGGFTSDDEVTSQIPESDKSTKVVKKCKAEPQSSSIFGLNWTADRKNLIFCRGTVQEVPPKITQRIVLSFVSALFDPLEICSPFSVRMRFLLKSIWLKIEQARASIHWCSE